VVSSLVVVAALPMEQLSLEKPPGPSMCRQMGMSAKQYEHDWWDVT
jgi:hypothetical protein